MTNSKTDNDHISIYVKTVYRGLPNVRVDRNTPLGNPFVMRNKTQEERDRVCDLYAKRFTTLVKNKDPATMTALDQLLAKAIKEKRLGLGCWCSPLRCHADPIAEYLRQQLVALGHKTVITNRN